MLNMLKSNPAFQVCMPNNIPTGNMLPASKASLDWNCNKMFPSHSPEQEEVSAGTQ